MSWAPKSVHLLTHTSDAVLRMSLAPHSNKAVDIYIHLYLQQKNQTRCLPLVSLCPVSQEPTHPHRLPR